MGNCEMRWGVGGDEYDVHSITTGSVSDFIKLVETGNGGMGRTFVGEIEPVKIDSSRTRFLMKVDTRGKEDGETRKQIVFMRSVGDRVNPGPIIFESINMELHKKGLNAEERMREIREMTHFKNTRLLLINSIIGVENCLVQVENRIKGAKVVSPLG